MSAQQFVRLARLMSGLVLMAFVAMHLTNLAIGLRSLDAMEDWRLTLMAPWQMPVGQILLAASALIHAALGLWSMSARRSLVMSATDVAQLGLGLITPPLLVNHVLALKLTTAINADFETSYGLLLAVFWSFAPYYAIQQLLVIVVVWVHAALGLYTWLVLKPIWHRIGSFVLPAMFAVPVLALLGFVESGKAVIAKLAEGGEWATTIAANAARIQAVSAQISTIQGQILEVYLALALLALAILAVRIWLARIQPLTVTYENAATAKGRVGLSILEFSRLNHIPHAHVCSGRGRCGTCRVKLLAGAEKLSPEAAAERATLMRAGAGPGERLACQALVLEAGVVIERILPAFADASAARAPQDWLSETPVPAAETLL